MFTLRSNGCLRQLSKVKVSDELVFARCVVFSSLALFVFAKVASAAFDETKLHSFAESNLNDNTNSNLDISSLFELEPEFVPGKICMVERDRRELLRCVGQLVAGGWFEEFQENAGVPTPWCSRL